MQTNPRGIAEYSQGAFGIGGLKDFISEIAEKRDRQRSNIGVILDHQYGLAARFGALYRIDMARYASSTFGQRVGTW